LLTGKFKEPPVFVDGDHRKYEERFTTGFAGHRELLDGLSREAAMLGATSAQLALARLLEKGATMVIPGMKTVAQVEENAAAADFETAVALLRLEKAGIKLNANHRRDFEALVGEIAGRDGLTAAQVISAPPIEALLSDANLNGPQKLGRIKTALMDARYPTYTRVCRAFADELKKLNLSPSIKITPTAYFEDTKLKVESTGKGTVDLKEIDESLARLAKVDVVKNAFSAAKNNS
jgi:hypothetical protein